MKEFKFACPVCEQHITAAPGTSGTQIQCPTCFQKIIVPQERTDDTKLILHAAKADRPRPPHSLPGQDTSTPQKAPSFAWLWVAAILFVAGAVAAGLYSRGKKHTEAKKRPQETNAVTAVPAPAIPTNSLWTLDSKKAVASAEPLAGMLNGQSFALTRTLLQGGALTFRQGKGSPPELSLTITFPAKRGEDLAGKKAFVAADQAPPVPKVVMRWKKPDGKTSSKTFNSGYVLKLELESLQGGKIPGRVFIALPDDNKSFLAGSFTAEVRAPVAPKKKPKQKQQVTTNPN